MNARRPSALALILLPLLMSACAARPAVQVERAAWTEQTEQSAVMHIDVEVSNPGDVPVELREMRYHVALDGRRVYSGRRSTAHTVAPGQVVQLSVPAVVGSEDIRPAGEVSITGSVVFITPGRLTLVMRDLGLPPWRRDFAATTRVAGSRE